MNPKQKTQNDIAWEALFIKYDILNRIGACGQYIISADQIKEFREPRLMVKFDHHINLPLVFSNNHLAILPVSRRDYVISNFKAYQLFESRNDTIIRATLPTHIQSLDANEVPSENVAINCALASGMFADFLNEETLYPTVSGRMGSGRFNFDILNSRTGTFFNMQINNSQIEIDAAFEGIASLALIEAKRDLSADFLIRQLYYPYRVWESRLSKKVKPIFLVYSNGIYRLYEYEFQNSAIYNSLVLIKHKNYAIEDTSIEMSDLIEEAAQILQVVPEPEISFPQADSFERVINMCELLSHQELSRDAVTEKYAFDIRQTNYYTDAGRYLGLIEKKYNGKKPIYYLTKYGRRIMRLNYKKRQLALCRCILQHRIFFNVFSFCQQYGSLPDRTTIVKIMKSSDLYNIESESTYLRRASTVSGWINWMFGLIS